MNIQEFDFELPEELIAQHAVNPRDHSKLLVLNKEKKEIEHKRFYNIIYLIFFIVSKILFSVFLIELRRLRR